MKMRTLLLTGILLLITGGQVELYGQKTRSSERLSYQAFKEQCINFPALRNSQLWVVYVWAGWNSTSLYDFEQLKRLSAMYSVYPIRFFGISEDENEERWNQITSEFQLPGDQVLLRNATEVGDFKRAFQYPRLPGYFVIADMGDIYQVSSLDGLHKLLNQKLHDLNPVGGEVPPTIPVVNPDPGPQVPVVSPPTSSQKDGWVMHTVKSGETLYRLQVNYGVPVAEIKKLNKLKGNNIRVGQVLKIRKLK